MTSEPTTPASEPTARTTPHVLHALLQFARVVRYRKMVVFGALAASALLGGLYFATTPRFYQSKASLLVLQSGVDVTNASMSADGGRQTLMPTYEKLFSSAVVLQGALKYLAPDERVDLQTVAPEKCVDILRSNLAATTARLTNIIEISYRSKTPKASVAVVNAILRSYLDFMDKTHKGTAGDIINVLTKERVQLDDKLARKEEDLLAARRHFGDLGIRAGGNVVHPMVQRAIGLNEAMIKMQEKRLELQAALGAIQAAVRNGEDLQQHMLGIENSVGREFMLSGLGFGSRDAALQEGLQKQLVDDRAELKTLQEYYGPTHPRIVEVMDRMRTVEHYLANYQATVNQRLSQIRDKQLGPLLIQIIQQRLAETWQHESSLRVSFEQARAEAVNQNGNMAQLEILEHDVKFLRDLRDVLLNQIASIDLKQDHVDIRTAVVSEPTLPKSPIWPKLPMVVVGCLFLGLAAGLGLVYVLDVLDDRFRSPEELRTQLGVPVLAMVRQMEDLQTVGLDSLMVHVSPDAVESEAFRTMRTTLDFTSRDTSRLVVSSAEPGDGKTTVLANLAVSYAQSGKRTLLIDADMRRPGLSAIMGLKGQSGLSDLLVSAGNVADEVGQYIHPLGLEGLDMLPAGLRRPNPAELLSGPRLAELLAWAETVYDQILIDSPPALAASDSSIIGRLVDGLVLVVYPKKNQRRLVVRAAESFTAVGINVLGVVVNRIGSEKNDTIYGYGAGYGYGYGYGYGEGYSQETDSGEVGTSGNAEPTVAVRRRAA